MNKLDHMLFFVEKWGIYLCFSVSLVALTFGVLTRYAFMRPVAWPDELSTYLFIFMSFLGASASVRDNSELKVDALYERFPQMRFGLDLFLHIVRLGTAVIFIVTGCMFIQIEAEFANISPVLHLPMVIIFCILPLFGFFLILRTIIKLIELFTEK
jgi:TRAP-type C4-dicarboxylate transport system permease small subunit